MEILGTLGIMITVFLIAVAITLGVMIVKEPMMILFDKLHHHV